MAGKCPEDLEEQFIKECKYQPTDVLALNYGKAVSTVQDWRLQLYREGKLLWWPGIRVGGCRSYDDHLVLEGDAVVIGDLEVPYHDVEILGYAVSIGKLFGIKQLLIAGDFLANDAVGHFADMAEDTEESYLFTLADGIMVGGAVLEDLFQWFDTISIIKGNHEQRANRIKEIGFFNWMRDSWDGLGDLEISFYKWCELGKFRIEHPTFRKIPGSIARERAEIEDTSIMCAHTHGFSLTFTKNGKFQAIDLGHCTRPETRYYKMVNGVGPHPKWVSGFWVVRNDYAYGFTKEFTDWDFWLKQLEIK